MLRKLLLLIIKFMPAIQMVGMICNNTLYYFDETKYSYIIDFIIGNSIITTIALYVLSYVFYFCSWHRILITGNLINIIIAYLDVQFKLPISDICLLIIYYIVGSIIIFICVINHIRNNHERKIKNS